MKKRKGRIRRIYEYYDEDPTLITFSTAMKIIKICISIFIILFLKYIINTYNFTKINDIHNKINHNNYVEVLNNVSKSFTNITDNYSFLLFRARKNYEISEYYKSLKDCEQYLNLTNDYINIEICHLLVFNYIKMFDLEKAKEKLNICEKLDKNNLNNKKLFSIIQQEENKNEENIKKYKQYPSYLNFMKTLYKMGLYLNKLEINFVSENYRLCRATEDIYNKDYLVRLPLESLITTNVSRKGDMGIYFTHELERKLDTPVNCLLTTFLLNEMDKGNQSKWKFYIDFLPSSYNSFPSFYGEREYEILKGTQFLESLEQKKKSMKKDYDTLVNEIPGYSKYDFNLFKKMKEVVGSRVFGVKINGIRDTIIAPFADLLNHKNYAHTYWNYDDKSTSFFIKGISNIQKGSEVFDSYGFKSNKMFLLYYGFTVSNNSYNKFRIDLILNDTYPYIEEKMAILGSKNRHKSYFIDINHANNENNNFFSLLRFILYNKTDFKNITTSKPFSIDNEKQLFNKIKEIILFYLNKYLTTLEYDIDYLKINKNNMEFNDYNCFIIRIGEKEILNFYLNMSNDILQFLNSDKNYIKTIYHYLKTGTKNIITNEYVDKLYKYKRYLLLIYPLLNK